MKLVESELSNYSSELLDFRREHPSLRGLLSAPDLATIRTSSRAEYDALTEQYQAEALEVSQLVVKARRIAIVELMGSQVLQSFGQIKWVEIKEPDDSQTGKPTVLNRVTFYRPNLEDTEAQIRSSGVRIAVSESKTLGKRLQIPFVNGREVWFTQTRMDDSILDLEKYHGAKSLWRRDMDPKGKAGSRRNWE